MDSLMFLSRVFICHPLCCPPSKEASSQTSASRRTADPVGLVVLHLVQDLLAGHRIVVIEEEGEEVEPALGLGHAEDSARCDGLLAVRNRAQRRKLRRYAPERLPGAVSGGRRELR